MREHGGKGRHKRMEDKRATSVSTFSDPFSLYNLEEMLDRLQQQESERCQGGEMSLPLRQ